MMRLIIGSDHYGLPLKQMVTELIRNDHPEVDLTDYGISTCDPVDYPDIALPVAEAVARDQFDRGILICGTGAGMAICANKVPGVKAVCCHDPYTAERARKSNNAQIMTMGAQVIGPEMARMLVSIWLASDFVGGRSLPKVAKMDAIDLKYRQGEPGTDIQQQTRS